MPSATLQDRTRSALASASRGWLTPDDPGRRRAVDAIKISSGFSSDEINRALKAVFETLSENHLDQFISTLPASPFITSRRILHVAAGNVFTSWLHGAVITLLLGHQCWIKPSSHDSVFPALWRQFLFEVDPETAERVRVVPWSDDLFGLVDAIIAYGSDETLDLLESRANGKKFIRYGHKGSMGVVFASALQPACRSEWGKKLQTDVDAFDFAGCLSPQLVLVQGPVDPLEKIIFKAARPRFQSFQDISDIDQIVKRFGARLSCLGVAGTREEQEVLTRRYSSTIRICSLGDMQRPPLSWHNGGVDLVKELTFS